MIKRTGHLLTYVAFRGFELALRLLPVEVCDAIGGQVGRIAYLVAGRYRKLTLRNMRVAFGEELSDEEREKLARETFRTMGANLFCSIKLPLMNPADISARVEIEGGEIPRNSIGAGRGFVVGIPHMGCWEVLTQVPEMIAGDGPRGALYQKLRNPFFDRYVRRSRERIGYTLFDRSKGFGTPTKFLREGGALGVLIDQHAGDGGAWIPFFGRLCSTTTLAPLLSLRAKVDLLALSVYRVAPARWKVVWTEVAAAGDRSSSAPELAAVMNLYAEGCIRQSPANWFWVHNRWKTPTPKFLLSRNRRGVTLPPGMEMHDLKPFRILVRSPNWLGDACMAIPAVRAIKRGRPDALVTIITSDKLAPLWERVPEVDSIVENKGKVGPGRMSSALGEMGADFDAAILLPNSLRSALEVKGSGVTRIAGFAGHGRKRFLDPAVREQPPEEKPEHHTLRYLRLVEKLGGSSDGAAVGPFLRRKQTGDSEGGGPRVAVCPGAEYGPAKRLAPSKFVEAAKLIGRRAQGTTFVLVGVTADVAAGHEIEAGLVPVFHCENLIAKTDLDGLIDTLAGCDALMTNDTGTMHLAAVLGIPTVAAFGSTEPDLTAPIGEGHTIVRRHVECSPCFLRECPFGHYRCLEEIEPGRIASAVLESLPG